MIKLLLALIVSINVMASQQVGRIIKMTGDVQLFTNPSADKVAGQAPHVLFQGKYYSVKKARLGLKVGNGNILQTGHNSKARVVFKNGDQYNVAPGTAYEVNWSSNKKRGAKTGSIVNLMRGKIRAVVSKKGPRNNLKVKTRYASMGVRGTDFYVSTKGTSGPTKVSVLRGEVEMKVQPKPQKVVTKAGKKVVKVVKAEPVKAIKVKSGFTAAVDAPVKKTIVASKAPVVKPAIVKVVKTNKKELVNIQKDSVIKVKKSEVQKVSKETAKELRKLNKKAIETTLDDIKEYDPKLHEELTKKPVTNLAKVNTQVVKKVFKKAPEAPSKPGMDDLENIEEDAYEKYFTIE